MLPSRTVSSQVTEEFSEIMTIEKIKHRQLNAKLEEIKCLMVEIFIAGNAFPLLPPHKQICTNKYGQTREKNHNSIFIFPTYV